MRIESILCHISENKAVVQVNGWHNEKNLGSALAEGPTVEAAEDKAISRLNNRINAYSNSQPNINSINESKLKVELPKSEKLDNLNKNPEPSDWSNELTAIDSEIERLKWSRDDETNFLKNKLGYNSRNKITNYSDLVNYLSLLKNIDSQNQNKVESTSINSLIEESDLIIKDLSWTNIQGREFLQQEFNVSTRKELNQKQLILFVEKLKLIRNQYLSQ